MTRAYETQSSRFNLEIGGEDFVFFWAFYSDMEGIESWGKS
jgi:hypothetical protein